MKAWIEEADEVLNARSDIAGTVASLRESATRSGPATEDSGQDAWTFPPDRNSERFLHDTLADLQQKLDRLDVEQRKLVARRLSWAEQIEELSTNHPNAQHSWPDVRAAIARNPSYADCRMDLSVENVLGLAPIGENPVTGLWEFYHLRSAWDGESDPREISIPTHDFDGSIPVTEEAGIVFVLLPGGKVTLGSQNTDPDGPNYDRQADDDEVLHEVTLSPFFLARHEMTQAQWERLWSGDESLRQPSRYKEGDFPGNVHRITRVHPVEQVSWPMCNTLLTQHGLVLPTEAQWEYGCRGGTTTAWWVPEDQLQDVANVADALVQEHTSWVSESWRDGHIVHAPVGSFEANPFGLFDVHGNLWEWCREMYGAYGDERDGDGLREAETTLVRVNRGGSFGNLASYARSAKRSSDSPSFRLSGLGLRPARMLEP
jgi:formylglycine-generating enzyme required for sulfatase activity